MLRITHATSLLAIAIIALITPKVHTDCRKTFAYHTKYNYGYDVFCNHSSSFELSTTMANKAIFLTVINSNITFDSHTLRYLRKIRQLNITNSKIDFAPNKIQNQSTENPLEKPNMFSFISLPNLETLIVENSQVNTENLQLNGLQNLITLKLNNITFKPGNFSDKLQLNKLQTLSLKNNGIKNIREISMCNYSVYSLRNLFLDNNLIENLEGQEFKCLTSLETLSLSWNNLQEIEFESKTLQNLNLSRNRLSLLRGLKAPSLELLDLSSNKLGNIKNSEFQDLERLVNLNLSRNNLTGVNLTNKFLTSLDLGYNELRSIPKMDLPSLKVLKLSYNEINHVNSSNLGFKSLETFEISHNNLSNVESTTFFNLLNISDIDLSFNNLTHICLTFFKNNSLTKLNLSHNNLDSLLESVLTNLTKLKHFDISHNRIKFLNDSTFKPLESLALLNMSHNFLSQLDYKLLEPLESLIVLDVDNNMIQELDYGTIVSELVNLEQFKTKNNLLTCEMLTKMIHFFKENGIVFSLNEHLDYDKENVEGIYCIETKNKLEDLRKAKEALLNSTQMLNALYVKYQEADASSYSMTGGEIVATLLSLISLVVVLTLGVQRVLLWHRRRQYFVDELELITKEPYKRLGSL